MKTTSLAVYAGLASLLDPCSAQITQDLVNFWDYGRSPPVYPSPQGQGTGDWAAAYAQARALVSQMTNLEKQNTTIPFTSATNGCSGNSGGVPRLGYPGLCLSDAGNGVRGVEGATAFSSGIHVGATWNKDLAYSRGYYMGAEFKAKGVNMALGPVVGPLGRVATGGRNWEGFSNDPYLSGQLVYETVVAMQKSTIACTKHLILNEQETNRIAPRTGEGNASVSVNIDDHTMHELYLWPFQDALRAGTGAIMCSYNRINNSYGCQNSKVLNGLLKTELGFEGLVVSDWGAQHSGVASAAAGMDMVMPSSTLWQNLSLAVTNGSLPQSRLDDMATRIVATWYHLAPWTNIGFGMPKSNSAPHTFVNARDPASAESTYQSAAEGHVLVKNIKNTLPLKKPAFLSLFGYDAVAPLQNNPPASKYAFAYESLNITDAQPLTIFFGPLPVPGAQYNGTQWTGGGSGGNSPAYVDAPFQAFSARAKADNTWLAWDFISQNPIVDQASDACVVFANEFATEGQDRPSLADPYSDTLITNVASQCNNTIVVIHNAGIRLVDAFYSNPNVTAIIMAHLPGQDSGSPLVDLIYGKQSFSGRLPYTVAKQASDYGSLLLPTVPDNTSNYFTQSNFTEGVYIDYKGFIKANITPRFAFGFGMTYSTFAYSGLNINLALSNATTTLGRAPFPRLPPAAATLEGGNPRLFDIVATISATVTNTGSVAAAEVAQLYVGIPNGPPKVLRGFSKTLLQPGACATVSFPLTRRDLSRWDVVVQDWVLQSGAYAVNVGASVLDIRLNATMGIATR